MDLAPSPDDRAPDLPTLMARAASLAAARDALDVELLDVWRDVGAVGGLPAVTGWTGGEWLRVVAKLLRFEARRLEMMVTRLPGLPVTAALLACGKITFDVAARIGEKTTVLKGAALAVVERDAAELAARLLERGDEPDIEWDLDTMIETHRQPADVRRREQRLLDGSSYGDQPDLDGGGFVWANLDPVSYAEWTSGVGDAAGPPRPDEPRGRQKAAGMIAMATAWLGGPATTKARAGDDVDPDGLRIRMAAAQAKPSVTVHIDIAEATESVFATLERRVAVRRPSFGPAQRGRWRWGS